MKKRGLGEEKGLGRRVEEKGLGEGGRGGEKGGWEESGRKGVCVWGWGEGKRGVE